MTVSGHAGSPDAIKAGMKDYQTYCEVCHGARGKGDGPLSGLLRIGVPDLTLLAKWSDGNFPLTQVTEIIDGRAAMTAHGGRGNMPVWGMAFATEGEPGTAQGRILNITLYLESIQVK